MWQDPMVEEVRRIRDDHARKFNYDLHAICEDFRRKQLSSGRKVVTRKRRPPVAYVLPEAAERR
jgi:hypothetical protein